MYVEIAIFLASVAATSFGFILSQQYRFAIQKIERFDKLVSLSRTAASELTRTTVILEELQSFLAKKQFEKEPQEPIQTLENQVDVEWLISLREKLSDFPPSMDSVILIGDCVELIRNFNTGISFLGNLVRSSDYEHDREWAKTYLANQDRVYRMGDKAIEKIKSTVECLNRLADQQKADRHSFLQKHPHAALLGEEQDFWK